MILTAIKGAFISGSMIIAIGSQNAFLLKSGLKKNYVFTVATICFLGDLLLMTLGVFGTGALFQSSQFAQAVITILGSAFLVWYGANSAKSAFQGNSVIDLSLSRNDSGRFAIVISTLAITFLNPHVYLDTVVVVGGVASSLSTTEKVWFLSGALLASMMWFYGLGYAATKLVPYFQKKSTWRILDSIIATIMFYIAFELIMWAKALIFT
ncbi:LysE/ArgO family amino acid transporter [Endozoicomonas acroporae]|uniref:LysE/ArgO family amino acid transporter n=1 Tax=Endozoicomonas acroporae TaxID=1701104 RepID=UPI003D7A0C2E